MKKVDAKQIKEQGKLYGRTYMDETDKVLYFNWTCGGVEIEFTGTCLMADLIAWPDTRIEHIPGQTFGAIEDKAVSDWPWIGVVLDDEEELRQKILVDQPKKRWSYLPVKRKNSTE